MVGTHVDGFPRGFGPYLLLSSFGRGGMGEVFLAKRRVLQDVDRLCVVKTIRGDLSNSREYVARFLDEARLAVQLNHPHICQVYEAHQVGADHCLAMEYIPGVNLRELVHDLTARNERLDEGTALYVVEMVLDALAWAHDFTSPTTNEHLRIVHRDVSPANVMVGFDGDVKLIDFGLAESALKQEETETRLVMGKVAYMAPEQARGEDVDGAVDQFAAAVMLVELLTGERFYGGWNPHQIWQVVGAGGHRPASFASLPVELRAILDRALAAAPGDRYPTCEAFARALADARAKRAAASGKHTLRERTRALYGDRAAAMKDLIASFSDLRAPSTSGVAEAGGFPRAPVGAAPGASQMTDPWQTSPSSPAIAPLPNARPPSSAPVEATQTQVVPKGEGTATVARAAMPRSRAPVVVAGVAGLTVALALYAAWPREVAPTVVDAGPVAALDAGPRVEDAGTAVVAAIAPITPDAGVQAPLLADAGPARTSTSTRSTGASQRKGGGKTVDDVVEPVLPPKTDPVDARVAPREPSDAELWDAAKTALRGCKDSCAAEWVPLLDKPITSARDLKTRVNASKACVRACAR